MYILFNGIPRVPFDSKSGAQIFAESIRMRGNPALGCQVAPVETLSQGRASGMGVGAAMSSPAITSPLS